MCRKLLIAGHKPSQIIVDVNNQLKPSAVWHYYTNCLLDLLKLIAAQGENAAIFKVDREILYTLS